MAATPPPPPPRIHVYSQLPHNVTLAGNQLLCINWHWVSCLTFTLEELNPWLNQLLGDLQQWPYKWIHFAIAVVVGAQGELSTTLDTLNVVDYGAPTPAESANLYYRISNQERERVFPIDPDSLCTHITSTVPTSRWA
ncbi:hypothetical protein EDB85DRAFT_1894527 [Lactarius pseudohatsudake]|nr:hypothetical protein EDB85DRAFT_1894527 [Lactarius pseudohatsudake]